MNLTLDQIKRAAALLDALSRWDKEIAVLTNATEVSAYARNGGSPAAEFKRSRANGSSSWSDEHGAALHRFILGRYHASRAKVVRELRQLDVTIPEAPQ